MKRFLSKQAKMEKRTTCAERMLGSYIDRTDFKPMFYKRYGDGKESVQEGAVTERNQQHTRSKVTEQGRDRKFYDTSGGLQHPLPEGQTKDEEGLPRSVGKHRIASHSGLRAPL